MDLRSEQKLQIIKVFNPFDRKDRDVIQVDYVRQSLFDLRNAHFPAGLDVHVSINGSVIPNDDLALTFPGAGDCVLFVPAVHGDDAKNILRMVLFVAVAVVGFATGNAWVTGMADGFLKSAIEAGIAASVTLVGGLIINAVLPPPMPKMQSIDVSNAYGWSPQTTQQQGIIIPRLYGNNKIHGNVNAVDIESINDKQYLNVLLSLGMGPLAVISDLKINNQPISYFTSVEYEVRTGLIDQEVISNFNSTKTEHLIGQTVPITGRVFTTPNNDFNGLEITVSCPRGLWYANKKGGLDNHTVGIYIGYKKTTDANYMELISQNITANQIAPIIKTYKMDDLEPGDQYDIIVQKTTADAEGLKYGDEIVLHSVKEVHYDDFSYPRQALVGIRALATEELSGGFSFSCETTGQYIQTYNGTAWNTEVSNNLAWVAYNILSDPVFNDSLTTVDRYQGYVPARLDYLAFKAWADWCDELVSDGKGGTEKRFTFNGQFDSEFGRWEAFLHCCRLGRAFPVHIGSMISVVVDKATAVSQLFTVGNIKEASFQQTWLGLDERASEIEAEFINAENDHERDTISIYHPELDSKTRKVSMPMWGLEKPSEVWRSCIYQLAQNKYIIRGASWEADIDAIGCTVGDRVQVQHDVPLWGFGGRIVAATVNQVTIDKAVDWSIGDTWTLKVRFADDTIVDRVVSAAVYNPVTGFTVLSVSTPFTTAPAQYDIYAYGRSSELIRDFRVVGFQIIDDLRAQINGVEYREEIYSLDESDPILPDIPVRPFRPVEPVTDLALKEIYEVDDAGIGIKRVIEVAFKKPFGSLFHSARVYYRISEAPWRYAGETQESIFYVQDVIPETEYTILVQSVGRLGITLPFSECPTATITTAGDEYFDNTDLPPDVTGLGPEEFQGRDCWVFWDEIPSYPLLVGYRVQISTIADEILRVGFVPKALIPPSYTYFYGWNAEDGTAGPRRQFKVSVWGLDSLGRISENPAVVVCNNPPPSLANFTPTVTSIYNGLKVDWSAMTITDLDLEKFEVYLAQNNPPTALKNVLGPTAIVDYFTDLDADVTYYVQIVPYDAFGIGLASNVAYGEPLQLPSVNIDVELVSNIEMSDSDGNDQLTLKKLYDRNKTSDGLTYSVVAGAMKYVQYRYPVMYIVDRLLLWVSGAANAYVAYSNDGVAWAYLKAQANHQLDSDGELIAAGSEAEAQADYWALTSGRNVGVFPAMVSGMYFRLCILGSVTVEVYELVFAREVVAEEIVADNLSAISADLGLVRSGIIQSQNWGSTTGSMLDLNAGVLKLGGNNSPKLAFDDAGLAVQARVTVQSGSSGFRNLTDAIDVYQSPSTSPPPNPALNALWYQTNTYRMMRWNGGSWQVVANSYTNTNQLTDGAGLGLTAIWASITGAGKPESNATVGARAGVNFYKADGTLLSDADIITSLGIAADAARIQGYTLIEGGLIKTGFISASNILTGTLLAERIAAGSLHANKLTAGTITATQIAAGTITASNIATGTLTATQIAVDTITANRIVSNALLNGTRVNAYAQGTVTTAHNGYATITHNLGRYVVPHVSVTPSFNDRQVIVSGWSPNGFSVYATYFDIGTMERLPLSVSIRYAYI